MTLIHKAKTKREQHIHKVPSFVIHRQAHERTHPWKQEPHYKGRLEIKERLSQLGKEGSGVFFLDLEKQGFVPFGLPNEDILS